MLQAKFQNHRPSGSVEEKKIFIFLFFFFFFFAIYIHGGHLGHVTLTIYTHFHSHFLILPHIKFGFDWTSGFWKEDV